jgi:phosphoglycerate dehydrogenase-like enzyme
MGSTTTHRLLILSRHAESYRCHVEAAALPDLAIVSAADVASLPETAARSDLVFGEPSLIAQVLPRLPAVQWIQATWAGVEPLLDPTLRRDYVLTNARGVFGVLMCEYVFGYLLAYERRIVEKYESQKLRRWDTKAPGTLRGKTIGLLGVGTIGAALARTAKHFGMTVRGYTRASRDCGDVDEYFHAGEESRFAAALDYVVCIVPNTAATRRLIDRAFLAALPPRAVIVNPGRGSVIDHDALRDALSAGRLAAAVLDVFETEPLPPDDPLWRLPNVFVTSHTAALSLPADIAPLFIDNYRRLVTGQPLKYRVDFNLEY